VTIIYSKVDIINRRYLSETYNKKNGLKKVFIYSVENKDIMLRIIGMVKELI